MTTTHGRRKRRLRGWTCYWREDGRQFSQFLGRRRSHPRKVLQKQVPKNQWRTQIVPSKRSNPDFIMRMGIRSCGFDVA